MRLLLFLLLLVGVAACSSNDPLPPPSGAPVVISTDAARWNITFSPGMPPRPTAGGGAWYFDFPAGPDAKGAASVHYVTTPAVGRLSGVKLVVDYEIVHMTGAPVYQWKLGDPNNTCDDAGAHFSLYMQRRGDNLSGAGAYEFFRWFKSGGRITPGRATTIAMLSGADWTAVYGRGNDAQFQATLADLGNVGLTFGGGCFAGHGVNLKPGSGTSRFVLHGFAVH